MESFLITVALLCQATPGTTSTGGGYYYFPEAVRESNAKCQQRLIKCAMKKKLLITPTQVNLIECVEEGVVFDPPKEDKK